MSEPKQKFRTEYTISGAWESDATSLTEHELRFAQFSKSDLARMGELEDPYHEPVSAREARERENLRAAAARGHAKGAAQ